MSAFYTFRSTYVRVRTRMARVTHPSYGDQHWRLGIARQTHLGCAVCDEVISSGSESWRPMTHAGNRKDRICAGCMSVMSNGATS